MMQRMGQQKQKGAGGDPFGAPEEEQLKAKPSGIQIPDVHEAMRLAGVGDVQLDSEGRKTEQGRERDQDRGRKGKDKRYRLLCCCGVRGCGIGPMTKTEEVD